MGGLDPRLAAIVNAPRPDNSAYHRARLEAKQAHDSAVAQLGGPVFLETEMRATEDSYVITMRFSRKASKGGADQVDF